jgi:glycosyltransferase involved in cell wall biosynthesis
VNAMDESNRYSQKPPLISIIIPTARYSPYLPNLIHYIRDVCGKGEKELEILIVSTQDNPANKLYEVLCKYKECTLLVLERRPGEDARSRHKNLGVRNAKGEYVFILDDDSWVTCTLLDSMEQIITRKKPDALLHAVLPRPVSIWAKIRLLEKMFSSYNLQQSSARILRRELFLEIGGYNKELVVGEDIEFQMRLLMYKPRICAIPLRAGFEIHTGEYEKLDKYIRRVCYYSRYVNKLIIASSSATLSYILPPSGIGRLIRTFRLYYVPYLLYKSLMLLTAAICVPKSLISVDEK